VARVVPRSVSGTRSSDRVCSGGMDTGGAARVFRTRRCARLTRASSSGAARVGASVHAQEGQRRRALTRRERTTAPRIGRRQRMSRLRKELGSIVRRRRFACGPLDASERSRRGFAQHGESKPLGSLVRAGPVLQARRRRRMSSGDVRARRFRMGSGQRAEDGDQDDQRAQGGRQHGRILSPVPRIRDSESRDTAPHSLLFPDLRAACSDLQSRRDLLSGSVPSSVRPQPALIQPTRQPQAPDRSRRHHHDRPDHRDQEHDARHQPEGGHRQQIAEHEAQPIAQ